jgi:hypothetical protein
MSHERFGAWLQEVRLVNLPGRHADFCDIKTFFAAQSSSMAISMVIPPLKKICSDKSL